MAADGQVREIAKARKPEAPPPASTAPHVVRAVAAVMGELGASGISKDRKNEQQNYKFRGIDDVYNALSAALSAAHLVIVPKVLSRGVTERTTAKGGVLFYVVVEMEFRFVSALDGSDMTVGPFAGEAMDSGDKATNKAMSAAYKYMAMQTFCIPTEGDNDADATTHEVAAPDDTDKRLVEFKADCLGRIAKCDAPDALTKLWKKIEAGDGFRLMSERLPGHARALRTAMEKRAAEIAPAKSTAIEEDEIPF